MCEEDLKNLRELMSENKPRVLTMYFEDGGETSVVPYDDYYDLQQRIDKAIEYIESRSYECEDEDHSGIDYYCDGHKLLSILKGYEKCPK